MVNGQHEIKHDAITPTVARQIDENLRRLYDEAASEDLPKSLTDLLDALRQSEDHGPSG